jgi:hypothetical protein
MKTRLAIVFSGGQAYVVGRPGVHNGDFGYISARMILLEGLLVPGAQMWRLNNT